MRNIEQKQKIQSLVILDAMALVVWIFGILFYYLPLPTNPSYSTQPESSENILSDLSIIFFAVIIALVIIYLTRRSTSLPFILATLLGVMIFSTLTVFVPTLVALTISILIVYVERMYRNYATENFFVLLAVFAGTMPLAILYKADFLLILLVLFSIYDIVAVLFLKVIPKVATSAIKRGMPLLIAVPKNNISWFTKPTIEKSSAIMGAGDIFLPLIFLTSISVQLGITEALICLLGAVAGNIINISFALKTKHGIPAMPLMVIGMTITYLFIR